MEAIRAALVQFTGERQIVMFRISVITPVYNAEEYVRKAVESALTQPEVAEVILIEDASPDRSLAICHELAQEYPQVKLLQHPDQKNHGAGASRNLGIEHASSEYIAFLDADDYYLSHRFEIDRKILETDPTIDGVYSALGFHYYSQERKEALKTPSLTTVSAPVPPEELIYVLMGISKQATGYFSGDALTVRRSVFARTGLFDTQLKLSQDTHMWLKMALTCRLAPGILDHPVGMRGVHDENRVADKAKLLAYRPLLYRSLLEWAQQRRLDPLFLELFYVHYFKHAVQQFPKRTSFRIYLQGFFLCPGLFWDAGYFKKISLFAGHNRITHTMIRIKESFQRKLGIIGRIDRKKQEEAHEKTGVIRQCEL